MKNRRCYLQLGRAGDILNILPLAHRDFISTGERPLIVVQESYARLFEGITYAEPILWSGEFEDVAGALSFVADKMDKDVFITQIYGRNFCCTETCSSFLRQSWASVPDAPAWGTLPLVFDRRDPAREQSVIQQLRKTSKPYVLVNTDGVSSPFPQDHVAAIKGILDNNTKQHGINLEVIDLSGFHTDRFFDMLGLLEGAHALVTIDSGLLHLAHAVPSLPVIAIITREPSRWHGSAWRPQQVARFFYDEFPECIYEFNHAVLCGRGNNFGPRVHHVWSHFADQADADTLRRMAHAHETWRSEYENFGSTHRGQIWRSHEFRKENKWRDSGDAPINDPKPIPFIHDLIGHVLAAEPHDLDIIALTNADVCFCRGLTGWILDVVPRAGAAFTHRWDFYSPLDGSPLTDQHRAQMGPGFYPLGCMPIVNEADVARGKWYPGSDAFFFTVEWWRAHAHEYPDMLLGREQNDEILRQLIKRHGGLEIPAAIYHEKHPSYWEHHGNRETNPGNKYNRRLAHQWFLKTGLAPNDPEWWKIPTCPAASHE